ncbi:MAG: FtsL-like putative cell division protein [Bacteroidaceae bacterium]
MKKTDNLKELLEKAVEGTSDADHAKQGQATVNFDKLTADADLNDTRVTLRSILGGDIFTARRLRKQLPLIAMIVVFLLLYIGNRYSSQSEMIETEKLRTQLADYKSLALIHSSLLLEKTRKSRIENYLRTSNDSSIQVSNIPPYVIKVD